IHAGQHRRILWRDEHRRPATARTPALDRAPQPLDNEHIINRDAVLSSDPFLHASSSWSKFVARPEAARLQSTLSIRRLGLAGPYPAAMTANSTCVGREGL